MRSTEHLHCLIERNADIAKRGVVFELPMVSWFLSKLGILTPEFMRKYRRHSIVVIFVLAAFLTPGTDPVSQVLLAVPLMVLYEISIWIAAIAARKRAAIHPDIE